MLNMKREYTTQITVQDRVFPVGKTCKVDEHSPYFWKEIDVALGRAVEKILEDRGLNVSEIDSDSISYKHSRVEHAEGQVLEVKIFDAEIKTKEGESYSLKEYTYPKI
jgi:hypothetical protein